MKTNAKDKPFQVEVIESERGWGQKVDSVEGFDTKAEAEAYITKFNSRNTATVVPDWYMYARAKNF